MACLSNNSSTSSDQYGFKIVPETLQDITPEWCEKALQNGSTISKAIKVTNLEVKGITNEDTGAEDGGGLSGSTLVKLIPSYR